MLATYTAGIDLASGLAGENIVTLAYPSQAANIAPGALIAINGIEEYAQIEVELGEALSATEEDRVKLVPSSAYPDSDVMKLIGDSEVYLRIGTEIVWGIPVQVGSDVEFKFAKNGATSVGRGKLGTAVSAHSSGTTAVLMVASTHRVVDIDYTAGSITLDPSLPHSLIDARALVGSFGTRLSGNFVVDGECGPGAGGGFLCVASALSSGFTMEGEIDLRNAPHGGLMLMACRDARIRGRSIVDCGRPDADTGAAVWGFGGGDANEVSFGLVRGGHLGLASDNKSFGVPGVGTIDSETNVLYRFEYVKNVEIVADFTGTKNNTLFVGRMDADVGMPSFNDSQPSEQTTGSVQASGNLVLIQSTEVAPSKLGGDASLNTLVVNGAEV